jgi:hypothetical protein
MEQAKKGSFSEEYDKIKRLRETGIKSSAFLTEK